MPNIDKDFLKNSAKKMQKLEKEIEKLQAEVGRWNYPLEKIDKEIELLSMASEKEKNLKKEIMTVNAEYKKLHSIIEGVLNAEGNKVKGQLEAEDQYLTEQRTLAEKAKEEEASLIKKQEEAKNSVKIKQKLAEKLLDKNNSDLKKIESSIIAEEKKVKELIIQRDGFEKNKIDAEKKVAGFVQRLTEVDEERKALQKAQESLIENNSTSTTNENKKNTNIEDIKGKIEKIEDDLLSEELNYKKIVEQHHNNLEDEKSKQADRESDIEKFITQLEEKLKKLENLVKNQNESTKKAKGNESREKNKLLEKSGKLHEKTEQLSKKLETAKAYQANEKKHGDTSEFISSEEEILDIEEQILNIEAQKKDIEKKIKTLDRKQKIHQQEEEGKASSKHEVLLAEAHEIKKEIMRKQVELQQSKVEYASENAKVTDQQIIAEDEFHQKTDKLTKKLWEMESKLLALEEASSEEAAEQERMKRRSLEDLKKQTQKLSKKESEKEKEKHSLEILIAESQQQTNLINEKLQDMDAKIKEVTLSLEDIQSRKSGNISEKNEIKKACENAVSSLNEEYERTKSHIKVSGQVAKEQLRLVDKAVDERKKLLVEQKEVERNLKGQKTLLDKLRSEKIKLESLQARASQERESSADKLIDRKEDMVSQLHKALENLEAAEKKQSDLMVEMQKVKEQLIEDEKMKKGMNIKEQLQSKIFDDVSQKQKDKALEKLEENKKAYEMILEKVASQSNYPVGKDVSEAGLHELPEELEAYKDVIAQMAARRAAKKNRTKKIFDKKFDIELPKEKSIVSLVEEASKKSLDGFVAMTDKAAADEAAREQAAADKAAADKAAREQAVAEKAAADKAAREQAAADKAAREQVAADKAAREQVAADKAAADKAAADKAAADKAAADKVAAEKVAADKAAAEKVAADKAAREQAAADKAEAKKSATNKKRMKKKSVKTSSKKSTKITDKLSALTQSLSDTEKKPRSQKNLDERSDVREALSKNSQPEVIPDRSQIAKHSSDAKLKRAPTTLSSVNPKIEDIDYIGDIKQAVLSESSPWANTLLYSIVLFFIVAVFWANNAYLDVITSGQGKVIPSSQVQVVQNLEGGIVDKIFVSEGDTVKKGQKLVQIDDTRFAASYNENLAKYMAILGSVARLEAEVKGEDKVVFPKILHEKGKDIIASESQLFDTRKEQLDSNLYNLHGNLELADKELKITEPLVKEGLMSQLELLRLQREINEIKGQINTEEDKFQSEAQKQLTAKEGELAALSEQLKAVKDRKDRTMVVSPVPGIVKKINIVTEGGVIQPGMDIMEIVPSEDSLLIEAKISPSDIAFVNIGDDAVVKISAYDYAIYGGLKGKVNHISADTIQEQGEKEEKSYYKIYVITDTNYIVHDNLKYYIRVGMTVTTDVLTDKKTVLDYILKPILRARERALRER